MLLTLDLGGARHLDSLTISWEFPAKSFAIDLAGANGEWEEAFATTVNGMRTTTVPWVGAPRPRCESR